VHASGRGEIMEDATVDLHDYYFVLIFPGIHVNTGEVFKELQGLRTSDPQNAGTGASPSLKQIITLPVTSWRDTLTNVFEVPVFKKFPEIKKIKDLLYDAGAAYASMTGTGSSVYGIFHKNKKAGNLKTAENYKLYILNKSH
jgi:4-diphosphocytidyl-2-C-methyl-D-erythritol kinase